LKISLTNKIRKKNKKILLDQTNLNLLSLSLFSLSRVSERLFRELIISLSTLCVPSSSSYLNSYLLILHHFLFHFSFFFFFFLFLLFVLCCLHIEGHICCVSLHPMHVHLTGRLGAHVLHMLLSPLLHLDSYDIQVQLQIQM